MSSVDIFFYCHNQDKFVVEGLDSIMNQQEIKINKLIILDDGSSDETQKIISCWISKNQSWINLNPSNFEFWTHESGSNLGQSASLKEGLKESAGEYFAILEGDDVWIQNNHVANLVKILEERRWLSVAFSSWISLTPDHSVNAIRTPDDEKSLISRIFDFKRLLIFNAPGTLSACVYRGNMLRLALTKIETHVEIADFGLNLIMSQYGPLYFSPEVTLNYRYVAKSAWRSISTKDQNRIYRERLSDYARSLPTEAQVHIAGAEKLFRDQSKLSWKLYFVLSHPKQGIFIIRRKVKNSSRKS